MRRASLAALVLLAACSRASGSQSSSALAPPGGVAIGPIPGPTTFDRAGTPNPYAGSSSAARAGREDYVRFNCYGCHGGHAGGGMGPSLRDPDWLYGSTAEQIYDSIARGRGRGMPAWQTRLPEVEIWRLVSYIQMLGSSNEPDPPR